MHFNGFTRHSPAVVAPIGVGLCQPTKSDGQCSSELAQSVFTCPVCCSVRICNTKSCSEVQNRLHATVRSPLQGLEFTQEALLKKI